MVKWQIENLMFYTKPTYYKTLFCFVAFVAMKQNIIAQSYYQSPNDSIVANAVYDDVNVYNIQQINTSTDTLRFVWKKLLVSLPSTWEASICDAGHCYTSIVDSSEMNATFPGDAGLISLHLNPHFEAGTGVVQVVMNEKNEPMDLDTLTWIITANGALSTGNIIDKDSISFYPNPVNDYLIIANSYLQNFQFTIHDVFGNKVLQNYSSSKSEFIDTKNFSNGIYILSIFSNNKILHHQIIKK